ncbi:MAG: BON domain-containing protein [Acidobacteria bacterium]|nr:BON domain-containing protein [Acidobacteriota bacterium]
MVLRISIVILLALAAAGCAKKHAATEPVAPPKPTATPKIENVANIRTFGQGTTGRELQRELVTLPYYGVFDNLAYQVEGDTVTLYGQVTRPELKTDAEKVAKGVQGIEHVINKITVLPMSADDDRLRLAEYRAIYNSPGLERYATESVPPIHIIVDNGKVTLEGVVSTEADKELAGIDAKSVAGVTSVSNNLTVQ